MAAWQKRKQAAARAPVEKALVAVIARAEELAAAVEEAKAALAGRDMRS